MFKLYFVYREFIEFARYPISPVSIPIARIIKSRVIMMRKIFAKVPVFPVRAEVLVAKIARIRNVSPIPIE